MKRVLVTGANGLLGRRVVDLLLSNGYKVRGLVRVLSRFEGPKDDNLELVCGDLTNISPEIFKEVDTVVNTAAVTAQDILSFRPYWINNVEATISLFRNSAQSGVEKFIFVSTANTLAHGSKDEPGDEEKEFKPPFNASKYAISKKITENYLLRSRSEMETVIVHPTFIIGPGNRLSGSGRMIHYGWGKKFIFCPTGGKNFVHVDDVAQGIVNCIAKAQNRQKYLLAGENLDYKTFFKLLASFGNTHPIIITIPSFLLMLAGIVGEILKMLNIRTDMSIVNMKILCIKNYYSNTKSVRELGMQYRTIKQALADSLLHFNYINPQPNVDK